MGLPRASCIDCPSANFTFSNDLLLYANIRFLSFINREATRFCTADYGGNWCHTTLSKPEVRGTGWTDRLTEFKLVSCSSVWLSDLLRLELCWQFNPFIHVVEYTENVWVSAPGGGRGEGMVQLPGFSYCIRVSAVWVEETAENEAARFWTRRWTLKRVLGTVARFFQLFNLTFVFSLFPFSLFFVPHSQ